MTAANATRRQGLQPNSLTPFQRSHAASRSLIAVSRAYPPDRRGRLTPADAGPKVWLREFHRLLVKIAVKHAEIVSWSITVGIDFSLTVNFADRKARAEPNSDFRDSAS